ncbi:hypothetical protein [Marinoscillum furvescens]|uniref:UbiA prenyltransferase family protein n=1 Tax=Marinoscillum furvescens DSM 4134 TaxID=1122208 RepID=A0A3D9L710_MARFU|nr:hypothetical protein [Marinoscillum furvescens]REE00511.1 hypothetical protein C7460_105134 [Marinoscillum furvescens DSM 4134]
MDHFYKYFRWLSLDIVLGAIFFLAFLEKYFQVALTGHVYFALGAAIWLIYTADHLIDARSVSSPSTGRHRFHLRYYSSLIVIGATVLCLSLVNIYFLEGVIIRNGALLAACCIGYLLAVYLVRGLWVKEVLVAMVYALGVYLAPFSLSSQGFPILPVIQLAGVAFLNLLIFSFFDQNTDKSDGFNSLVLRLGKTKITVLIWGLSAALVVTSVRGVITNGDQLQWLYLVMTAVLLVIYLSPKFFNQNERYRTLGDGVFYLPGFLLLL